MTASSRPRAPSRDGDEPTRPRAAAELNPPLLALSSSLFQSYTPRGGRFRGARARGRLRSHRPRSARFVCRRAEAAHDGYKVPDRIPEFAARAGDEHVQRAHDVAVGAEEGRLLRGSRGGNIRRLHRDLRDFLGTHSWGTPSSPILGHEGDLNREFQPVTLSDPELQKHTRSDRHPQLVVAPPYPTRRGDVSTGTGNDIQHSAVQAAGMGEQGSQFIQCSEQGRRVDG
ncbi:hypothetical protein GUJ93_ZPchr0009g1735 [Zizania palustris]|uniref:Uncharacterized protein n=1 Tax=Zizania palustris TaxID=103762 RepID=A0A8J5RI80_ZIZPA|nr:hypothetical protein GUJ93_ZPchr0009g1735 [Zizania palustris]